MLPAGLQQGGRGRGEGRKYPQTLGLPAPDTPAPLPQSGASAQPHRSSVVGGLSICSPELQGSKQGGGSRHGDSTRVRGHWTASLSLQSEPSGGGTALPQPLIWPPGSPSWGSGDTGAKLRALHKQNRQDGWGWNRGPLCTLTSMGIIAWEEDGKTCFKGPPEKK